MTSGLTTAIGTSALSRETPTKATPETAETHIEKRLKRLWVRIGETLKRLRSTSAGRWWLVWVSGGRKWVLGSSKAVKVACLAVFDPSTNSALSQLLGIFKKTAFGVLRSRVHDVWRALPADSAHSSGRHHARPPRQPCTPRTMAHGYPIGLRRGR